MKHDVAPFSGINYNTAVLSKYCHQVLVYEGKESGSLFVTGSLTVIQIQQVVAARQGVFLPGKTDLSTDYTSVNDSLAANMSSGLEFLFTTTISREICGSGIQIKDSLFTLKW